MSARISGAHAGCRRWLPKSTRWPATSKLPASPPTTGARSSTVAAPRRVRASRYAAPTPEGPAPRIAMRGALMASLRSAAGSSSPCMQSPRPLPAPRAALSSRDVLAVPDHEMEEPPQRAPVVAAALHVLVHECGHGLGAEQLRAAHALGTEIVLEHVLELAPEPARVRHLEPHLLLVEDRGRQDALHRPAHEVLLPQARQLEPRGH